MNEKLIFLCQDLNFRERISSHDSWFRRGENALHHTVARFDIYGSESGCENNDAVSVATSFRGIFSRSASDFLLFVKVHLLRAFPLAIFQLFKRS